MDADGLATLLTPSGWEFLQTLPRVAEADALATGQRLRDAGHDPALVAAAMTQTRLRSLARVKFGPFADSMLFTEAGLQMATRLDVAARHAQRFMAAEVPRVWDLGCGIGADAMALAALDVPVTAVERDEITASVATVNLRHFACATVLHADAETVEVPATDGVFLDPARRTISGSRRHDPRACSPDFATVLRRCAEAPAAGAKLAPALDHDDIPAGVEAQWVSVDGSVVEVGLWWGRAARPGVVRSAAILSPRTGAPAVVVDSPHPRLPDVPVGDLADYLHEPDGAIIRAGLLSIVADELQATVVDETIAYLTTAEPAQSLAARSYRVLDAMPFGVKRLRSYLAERGVGSVDIKKRGTAVTPEELRKSLRLKGSEHATLVLTRLRGAQHALIVDPL